MNPYLARKRTEYDSLRSSVEGLQTRAADEGRDLTDTEAAAVAEQVEQMRSLHGTITELTEIETRNAQVAALNAQVTDDVTAAVQHRGELRMTSSTTATDRDPGHYTRSAHRSFFADMVEARHGNDDAARRITEHQRALSTGVAGAGVVPPKWLAEEFDTLARQGRNLANAVRNIDLGNDPRPFSLPRQTTGVDAVVVEQATQNTHPAEADAWASAVDTVTPKPTSGIQVISRQMLDMANPAIDALIYGDLIAAYNLIVEKAVGAALVTASGTAVLTYATESAFTAGTGGTPPDAVLDAAIAVRDARKLPADLVAMGVARYGKFLKLKDTTGRPLIPAETAGPQNVLGVGQVNVDGRLTSAGVGIIATDGVNVTGTYPDSIVVFRAADTILFESETMRFRYDEVAGPESIKLGIWGYTAVIVRQAGKSAKRVVVTAA